jgi:hypothetical protein
MHKIPEECRSDVYHSGGLNSCSAIGVKILSSVLILNCLSLKCGEVPVTVTLT